MLSPLRMLGPVNIISLMFVWPNSAFQCL
uniref:Uncharacterized protein n=1 Tax=Rhizophora mucronata TaxID=61149 RepID=A0A2P2NLW5_RHIMU